MGQWQKKEKKKPQGKKKFFLGKEACSKGKTKKILKYPSLQFHKHSVHYSCSDFYSFISPSEN